MEECKEKNMPVDKLSVFRGTRKRKDGNYNEDDGSAEIEENIKKSLEDYSPEEQNNLEVRNKIFEEVVGQDGHGRAFCMGTGIRLAPKHSRASSSSDKNLEVEVAQIREEAEEERIRHKEELEQVFNKSKEYVNEMLRRAGLSIPDDAIGTSSQP